MHCGTLGPRPCASLSGVWAHERNKCGANAGDQIDAACGTAHGRHEGNRADECPPGVLWTCLRGGHGGRAEPGRSGGGAPFGLYRGTPTDVVDVEAGFPVSAPIHGADGVVPSALPEGQALEVLHTGPYDTLAQTYADIQARMKDLGLVPADMMWEYYLSDPAAEPDPATWRTLVVWPVA
ncbi:transcription activator, effector binding protein [Arthrobacter sp. Hiyo6]|nr:transcription activator, effector binding protein [Arthrobacter sp. Hiyo6]